MNHQQKKIVMEPPQHSCAHTSWCCQTGHAVITSWHICLCLRYMVLGQMDKLETTLIVHKGIAFKFPWLSQMTLPNYRPQSSLTYPNTSLSSPYIRLSHYPLNSVQNLLPVEAQVKNSRQYSRSVQFCHSSTQIPPCSLGVEGIRDMDMVA